MSVISLQNQPTPDAFDRDEERKRRDEQDALDEIRAERAINNVLRLIAEATERLGGIGIAAGIAGVDRADLKRAIDRAKNASPRYVSFDAIAKLGIKLARVDARLTTELGAALVDALGLLVFPKVAMTAEQERDAYRAYMLRMPLGEQLIADALKGVKP